MHAGALAEKAACFIAGGFFSSVVPRKNRSRPRVAVCIAHRTL